MDGRKYPDPTISFMHHNVNMIPLFGPLALWLLAAPSTTITVPKHCKADVSPIGNSYPSPLHSIHVQPLLSPEEASRCLELARAYAAETGCWERKDSDRHAAYATCDFPIEECDSLSSYLEDIDYHERILGSMAEAYGLELEDLTYLDFFCANYEAREGVDPNRNTMDRLEPHRDGSLLSYTVLLTPPSNFEGGGTIFDALRDVEPTEEYRGVLHTNGVIRPNNAGDCCLHSGKLLHGADPVVSGQRTVLVAFVDVAEWCQRPETLALACRDWGRMDVASYRLKRQEKKTKGNRKEGLVESSNDIKGWVLNNGRWLSEGSAMRGYVPALETVERRGQIEFQRKKKLEAEDILLRDILLDKDERDPPSAYFGGDVTVL